MTGTPSAVQHRSTATQSALIGHLPAWDRHEVDGEWWAWVSWVQETSVRPVHKVVEVRAASLTPLEPPEA
jgi:hypothetical protein